MKRLITILLSFIGYVSLFGQQGQQGVPVLVAGEVYVKAPFRSEGDVHVYADSADVHKTGKITIDATAGVLGADTIILHSNHLSDGLLMNLNPAGVKEKKLDASPGAPKKVIIRRKFRDAAYTFMSFPFDVASGNVKRGGTYESLPAGDTSVGGDDDDGYWAWIFDAKDRREEARKDKTGTNYIHWALLDTLPGTYDLLRKGHGYSLYYTNATNGRKGGDVDFVTTKQSDIEELFSLNNKQVTFNIYATDTAENAYTYMQNLEVFETQGKLHDEIGTGWAYLGGLYSTTFTYDSTTTNYRGTIYYRNSQTSHEVGQTYYGYNRAYIPGGEFATLGPYTPFYVQYRPQTYGNNPEPASIVYKSLSTGLSLESSQFRSAQAEETIKDMLYLELLSEKNNTSDRFFLSFSNNYSDSYRQIEDASAMLPKIKVQDSFVWVLDSANHPVAKLQDLYAYTIDNAGDNLFVNGLPRVKDEGREVKVGFLVPETGSYKFTMDVRYREDVKNVTLIDHVTGNSIDLLQTPSYSFSCNAVGLNSERFVLRINEKSPTVVPSVETSQPYAFVKDNLLTVKNLAEGDRILVYDLTGRAIVSDKVSGKEFSTVLGQKGVYVVNVQVKGGQPSILKVLNK